MRLAIPLCLTLAVMAAPAVFADDSDKAPPAQHDQMMKHCMKMAKQNGAGASEADMKKQCEADIKSGKVNDGMVNDRTKQPTN
jgi:hypothetical protein